MESILYKSKKEKWKYVAEVLIVFVTYMKISRCKKFNYFAKKQIHMCHFVSKSDNICSKYTLANLHIRLFFNLCISTYVCIIRVKNISHVCTTYFRSVILIISLFITLTTDCHLILAFCTSNYFYNNLTFKTIKSNENLLSNSGFFEESLVYLPVMRLKLLFLP